MSIQLVQPNLATVGNIGYCLAFAENVFSTPHLYPTATAAWEATQFKHLDRNLPDASVPVWFSYFEGGVNYGHIAVHLPDGRVLSSPYKANNSQQIFSSIDQCASVLNCTYLGWSEDLATVRIIEGESMPSADEVKSAFRQYNVNGEDGTPQTPTANQIAYYTGSPWTKLLDDLLHYVADREAREITASNNVNAELQKELTDLKVLKAQEQATPDVPPAPVVINDPLSPAPAPDSPSTPVDTPPTVPPEGQGSEQNPNIPTTLSTPLKVAIGAVIALLLALAAWIH